MIEIYKNLFIGNDTDARKWGGAIIHAAQIPWFKDLKLPEGHLWNDLINENQKVLTLNLVDADRVEYIPIPLIERALEFIDEYIENWQILLHCNYRYTYFPIK